MPSVYLLDTNAISDAMKGQPNLVGRLAATSGAVVTSVIVQGEIRYGLDLLPLGSAARIWRPRPPPCWAA